MKEDSLVEVVVEVELHLPQVLGHCWVMTA